MSGNCFVLLDFSVTKSWHSHGIHIPRLIYSNPTGIPHYRQPRVLISSATLPQTAALHWYGGDFEEILQFYEFNCIGKWFIFHHHFY